MALAITAFLAAVILVILCSAAGTRPIAAGGMTAAWRRPGGTLLRGEVVLAHRLGRHHIALDCLVRPGMADDEPGVPVRIAASGPFFQFLGLSLTDIVLRWVGDDRRVSIEADRDPATGRPRVRLRTDRDIAVLEVADGGGLEWGLDGAVGAEQCH
jgi:hypothetical protein